MDMNFYNFGDYGADKFDENNASMRPEDWAELFGIDPAELDCGEDDISDEDYPDGHIADEDEEWFDESMDGDHESALASCGWGTDEDYGCYGGDSW